MSTDSSAATPIVCPHTPDSRGNGATPECVAARLDELRAMLLPTFGLEVTKEAVAETVLTALEWIADGRATAIPNRKAWLRRVAWNTAVTLCRRARKHVAVDPDRIPILAFGQWEVEQQRLAVADALADLSDVERRMAECISYEARSVRDAARILGISESTLRGRLAKLRPAVLKALRRRT